MTSAGPSGFDQRTNSIKECGKKSFSMERLGRNKKPSRLTMPTIQLPLMLIVLARATGLDIAPRDAEFTLGQAHAGQEPDRVAPLAVLPLAAPLQLLGHEIDDAGEGLQGSLGVQKGQPGAAGEDVHGRLGVLVADGVADLAVDERVEGRELGATDGKAALGGATEGGDGPGAVAVGFAQVLGDDGLDAEVLDQVDEERFGEAVGAHQADRVRLAGPVQAGLVLGHFRARDAWDGGERGRVQGEAGEGVVDGFFRHLAVGRPFPACAGEKARRGGRDQVVAHQGFGVFGIRVFHQRTDARPGC